MGMTPMNWILGRDTGLSSQTIWAVMMGAAEAPYGGSTPRDADDFGRCFRLLKHFPEWRDRLSEVAARFPEWGPLVREWAMLESLYQSACLNNIRAGYREFYDVISELNEEGRKLWVRPKL